ncbi:hypothetical protein Hamer_G017241 [Homarus americanus]|uniref:BHLH domain-containing protein n=1 Tax=Homarus americanus TaxID=6706 RepID=A0A8J5JVF0_HOMAM|nr:hypothetical protein Hamer_G017241 [Homarus americanus]
MTRNKSKTDKKNNTEEKKNSGNEKKSSSCDKKQIRQWEAARRHRFNNIIEKLRQELPNCKPKAKVEIIQTAIIYIQECKKLKESLLAGNEAQELRTCVQNNCTNTSHRKLTYGQRIPMMVGDPVSDCFDDVVEDDLHGDSNNEIDHRDGPLSTEKLISDIDTRVPPIVSGHENSASTVHSSLAHSVNVNLSDNVERKKDPTSLDISRSSETVYNNSSQTVIPSIGPENNDSITVPIINNKGSSVMILPQNCANEKESNLQLNCVGGQVSVLPQNCVREIGPQSTDHPKENIIVEGVDNRGTVTVSIIQDEEESVTNSPSKSTPLPRNAKLETERSSRISNTSKDLMLSSSDACLVVQDVQQVTIHPDVQNQPVSTVAHFSGQVTNSYNSQPQMVTLQVQGGGGDKGNNKGQKVVLLQCGNPGSSTIQLVPPIADNSQLTYVTPSLSGVPIMSTGVPPPILRGGKIMKMMKTSPLLLLPSQPILAPVPQPPRLKPIAPKPCACKTVSTCQSRGSSLSGPSTNINSTNKTQVSPAKKELIQVSSKIPTKSKRFLPLDKCDNKQTKRSRIDYESRAPAVSKLNPSLHPLQPLDPNSKSIPVNPAEISDEQGQDLQEISTSTLTGLVHSAGIMDCVEEDPLGNIMDIRVDMPCVITENIRGAGMETSNPADDRLVEMLRSIESDPRSCGFSPPSSPVTTSESFVKPVKEGDSQDQDEVEDHRTETLAGEENKVNLVSSNESTSNGTKAATLQTQEESATTQDLTQLECPVSSRGPTENSLSSSSYSITALCLSSRPAEDIDTPLRDISNHSISTSNSFIAELPDGLSEAQSSMITSTVMSGVHPRVSTPLILPTSVYPSTNTSLLSRENLPKASSAPTICQLPLPTSLPPPSIFHRSPSVLSSNAHSLPLALPPLPVPHLPSLPTEHYSSAILSSPSIALTTSSSSLTSAPSSTSKAITNAMSPITLPSLFSATVTPPISLPSTPISIPSSTSLSTSLSSPHSISLPSSVPVSLSTSSIPTSVSHATPSSQLTCVPRSLSPAVTAPTSLPSSVQPVSSLSTLPVTSPISLPQLSSLTESSVPISRASSVPITFSSPFPHTLASSVPHTLASSVPHTLASSAPHTFASSAPHTLASSVPHTLASSVPQTLASSAPHTFASSAPHTLASSVPHTLASSVPQTLASSAPHTLHHQPHIPLHHQPHIPCIISPTYPCINSPTYPCIICPTYLCIICPT